MLRNSFRFENFFDICFPENYDNNVLISMNSSSCQLSFNTLIYFLGCTYAILGRLRNFTKINIHRQGICNTLFTSRFRFVFGSNSKNILVTSAVTSALLYDSYSMSHTRYCFEYCITVFIHFKLSVCQKGPCLKKFLVFLVD